MRVSQLMRPQGPSFTVDGWHVSWQHWDVRLSFNGREGLVLHDVGYRDPDQGGRRRPVLHRGSIAEMAVPYAGEGTGLLWLAPVAEAVCVSMCCTGCVSVTDCTGLVCCAGWQRLE